MTVDEIKAMMSEELAEDVEDTRMDSVYSEISDRDSKIDELTSTVQEMTDKIASLTETNAKLVEQIKYVEPEEKEPEEKEPEYEFEDFSSMYEEV